MTNHELVYSYVLGRMSGKRFVFTVFLEGELSVFLALLIFFVVSNLSSVLRQMLRIVCLAVLIVPNPSLLLVVDEHAAPGKGSTRGFVLWTSICRSSVRVIVSRQL